MVTVHRGAVLDSSYSDNCVFWLICVMMLMVIPVGVAVLSLEVWG